MKTFREFIKEVYDPDVVGKSQIRKQGEGGRVGRMRKQSEPEKRRMKAVGGGKMVPAKTYKDRKDIGTQRKTSDRHQLLSFSSFRVQFFYAYDLPYHLRLAYEFVTYPQCQGHILL